jgi:hypothetical protein
MQACILVFLEELRRESCNVEQLQLQRRLDQALPEGTLPNWEVQQAGAA